MQGLSKRILLQQDLSAAAVLNQLSLPRGAQDCPPTPLSRLPKPRVAGWLRGITGHCDFIN